MSGWRTPAILALAIAGSAAVLFGVLLGFRGGELVALVAGPALITAGVYRLRRGPGEG